MSRSNEQQPEIEVGCKKLNKLIGDIIWEHYLLIIFPRFFKNPAFWLVNFTYHPKNVENLQ